MGPEPQSPRAPKKPKQSSWGSQPDSGLGMSTHHRVNTLEERAVARDEIKGSGGLKVYFRLAELEMSRYFPGKICKRN